MSVSICCALAMLLSTACSGDTDTDKKNTDTGSSISTIKTDDSAPSASATVEVTEAATVFTGTTAPALEPEDLGINISDDVPFEYYYTLTTYMAMVQSVVNNDMVDNKDGTFSSAYFPYPMMSYSMTEAMKELKSPTLDTFGYAIKDINDDGVLELILMCDNGALLEIYTILDGTAKLATFFWPGFTGTLSESGELYTKTLSSSTYMDYYAIEALDPEKGYFVASRRLGHNSTDDPSEMMYYENTGEDEFNVPKVVFDEFISTFPKIPKFGEENVSPSGVLEFIPISIKK